MEWTVADFSPRTIGEWQGIVNLLARISGVRAGLIMRLTGDEIEVFVSSTIGEHPYHPGDREHFYNSGLYCEAVIQAQDKLNVLDARQTERFNANPDLKYGMTCYLGFPIRFPDGKPFGTICLLDDKANRFSPDLMEMMEKLRDLIESQLELLDENRLQRQFASQSLLRRILDNLPIAVACATSDVDQRVIYLNQRFQQLFGYTLVDLPKPDAWFNWAFTDDQQKAQVYAAWQTKLAQAGSQDGRMAPAEIQAVCKDGRLVDVLTNATIVDDLVLVSFVDITERKRAETELRLSEARFRLLAENISDVIWVLNLNTRRFTYISSSIEQLRGYTVEEALAESMEQALTPESIQVVTEKLVKNIPLFLADPSSSRAFISEIQQPCKDGSIIWVEVTIKFRLNALREVEVLGVSRNIERRKQAEIQLRLSEARHRLLADHSIDVIATLSLDGRLTYVNPAVTRITGFTPEELVGAPIYQTFTPAAAKSIRQDLRQARDDHRAGRPVVFPSRELELRCKDGSTVWIEYTASGLQTNGDVPEVLVVARNISERKKHVQELKAAHAAVQAANAELEQRVQERTVELRSSRDALAAANTALERALRARDEFLSTMSHELRTPLAGILGLAELLQYSTYGSLNEKQQKAVWNIETSGKRLLDLVDEVLDYTQVQSGCTDLQLHPCSLDDICRVSLQVVESQAAVKAQQLEQMISPPDLQATVDERRLAQVLVNLLENAIKFTPAHGRIRLSAVGDVEKQQVQISVADTGIGMRAEDLPRLFKPFGQLDARLAREYEGAGLGLALVKALVEQQGGSVSVESALGHGSTFTVTLPWPQPSA
ncbi:MAG: PAS domain S-box protein [Chloroflexota bacterium]